MDPEALKLYERWGEVLFKATWLGTTAAKNPGDAWIYQELIYKHRPDLIIETGSFKGGGALYLASLLDLCGIDGKVISIDITNYDKPRHPRIEWLTGSSVDKNILDKVFEYARGKHVMVVLDSDHDYLHVKQELAVYSTLVSFGQYLIVEDTWWKAESGGGPMQAVDEFLLRHPEFDIDPDCERYIITNNPGGFLKRK